MKFDFSGYETFIKLLQGQVKAEEVLAHPAYRAIQAHAAQFGSGLSAEDIEQAVQGQPSAFFGLRDLRAHRQKIEDLVAALRASQREWLGEVGRVLSCLLPEEDLTAITIYPLIGYDMGIGLRNAVCMNLNYLPYQEQPQEFVAYAIHECVHVLYERHHEVPPLRAVNSQAAWLDYFALFLQNEGFAVYAPWNFRREHGLLDERDYRVLEDPAQASASVEAFRSAWRRMAENEAISVEECMELAFGDRRLTYRAGAHFIRRIEEKYGLEEVRRAFYMSGQEFVEKCRNL